MKNINSNEMVMYKKPWNLMNSVGGFDRIFDDWLVPFSLSRLNSVSPNSLFTPPCDIEEQEDHYLLMLEMPGVSKDEIKIETVNDQIVISGERRNDNRKKEDGYAYSERQFGKFQRTFALPSGVDVNQIEAHYQDGVLRVVVPKAEAAKPRQIQIK